MDSMCNVRVHVLYRTCMCMFPVNPQLVPTAPVNRQAQMVDVPSTSQQSLLMHQPPYPMVRENMCESRPW